MNRIIDALIAKIPVWLAIPLLACCLVIYSAFNTSHYKIALNKEADLAKIVNSNDIVAYLSVLTIEEDKSATEAIADTKDEKEDKSFSDFIGGYQISYDIRARRKSDNAVVFKFDNSRHFEYPQVIETEGEKAVSHKTSSESKT
jgi:hypothetical protein